MERRHLNTSLSQSIHNVSVPNSVSTFDGLIPLDLLQIIIKCLVTVDIFLALAGVLANYANATVFWKMGISDSVNLTFFSLSLADLGVTFFMFLGMINRALSFLHKETSFWFELDPFFLHLIMTNTGVAFITSSVLLTTFMAVQRCCCVILPFQFRTMFTKSRSVFVVVAIFLYSLVFVFGYTCLYGVQRSMVPGTNRTSLQVLRRHFRDEVLGVLSMVNIFCVKMPCQIIVLICVIAMARGLRRSVEFRKVASKGAPIENQSDKSGDKSSKLDESRSSSSSSSEIQLIKSVILVSTVFVFCNTPSIVIVIADDFVPELGTFGKYRNMFTLIFIIRQFCELFSSSFNFVIYFTVNKKFRTTLAAMRSPLTTSPTETNLASFSAN